MVINILEDSVSSTNPYGTISMEMYSFYHCIVQLFFILIYTGYILLNPNFLLVSNYTLKLEWALHIFSSRLHGYLSF